MPHALAFNLAFIIAGVFLVKAEPSGAFARKLTIRLAGERGEEILGTAGQTVKNVAKRIPAFIMVNSHRCGRWYPV